MGAICSEQRVLPDARLHKFTHNRRHGEIYGVKVFHIIRESEHHR